MPVNKKQRLVRPATKLDIWIKQGKWQPAIEAYEKEYPLDQPLSSDADRYEPVTDVTIPEDEDKPIDVAGLIQNGQWFLYTQIYGFISRFNDAKYIKRYPADFATVLRVPDDIKAYILYEMNALDLRRYPPPPGKYIFCGRFPGKPHAFAISYHDGKLVRITGPKEVTEAEQGKLFEPKWIPKDLPVINDPEAEDMYRTNACLSALWLEPDTEYTVDELERRYFILMFCRYFSRNWNHHPMLRDGVL